MKPVSVKFTDSHNAWLGVEIDTDEFIEATLDEAEELNVMHSALAEHLDQSPQDCMAEFAELIGYVEISGDNTSNQENDLSSCLDFYVFMPKGDKGEWFYSDKALIFVKKHRGGDIRGNYSSGKFYKHGSAYGETAFLTWTASLYIASGVDAEGAELAENEMREVDEKWRSGYSSCPTSALEKDIEVIHEWSADSADVTLKNGWRVKIGAEWIG